MSFSLNIVTRFFFKVQWKHSAFIFLLRPEEDITGSSKLSILDYF